jgi:hypothetical protein
MAWLLVFVVEATTSPFTERVISVTLLLINHNQNHIRMITVTHVLHHRFTRLWAATNKPKLAVQLAQRQSRGGDIFSSPRISRSNTLVG